MGYYYRVDATRKVRAPEYGPEAYRSETKSFEIPFGKGQEIKTGAKALEVAQQRAQSLLALSSSVSVWRLTAAGNGSGNYLKDDAEARFDSGWHGIDVESLAAA